ncbi:MULTISPECIES: CNNM domain-containing protein [unclassified Microcoleus]|uniref:CNNM domain-containing protein n=1 Tax=unclassified Microcoleus TaxID=2642155 RepID=UPI0025D48F5C|nr:MULTISPECIES: CNNM domain-containing protein [unclassified Microcoleus]
MNNLTCLEIEVAETLLRLAMLLGLTLLIAFFVASELALVSADRHQIRQLAQLRDRPNAKTAELVHQAQNNIPHYLSVTQTGTTAGSLLLGWLGEGATVHWIEPWIDKLPIGHFPAMLTAHSIAVPVAFIFVTYIEIVLGELIPKVLATHAPERTALLLMPALEICSKILWPLLAILNGTVRLLTGWITSKQSESLLPASEATLVQKDAHSAIISGVWEVTAVNEKLGLNLPTNQAYQTIAGFAIHNFGKIPNKGDRFLWGELEIEAADVVEGSLETVLLRQVTRPLFEPQRPELVLN